MYLLRRNGVYWFRKAVPLDLIQIVGQSEVRFSLRTHRRDMAKRRTGQVLVALENVYAVLRSQEPLEPAKQLIAGFARDALENGASGTNRAAPRLHQAVAALGPAALAAPARSSQTLVPIDDIDAVLQEQPRAEVNRVAVSLLKVAMRFRRSPDPHRERSLASLCQRLVTISEEVAMEAPAGLEAIRAVIREEISQAQLGPVDLRNIVATEVRQGVAAAGRDRWSVEPLSSLIEKFLQVRYPSAQDGKGKVGSKHRQDVEQRLAAFVRFVGDKPVRDVTRDDLKRYRDLLDQLPDRFELRFGTSDMLVAIEKNRQRKSPHPIIGPTTIDLKWLGAVNRLFQWLVLEEKIEKNPVDGIRSNQETPEAANTKRLPLKPDQISRLFAITSAASSKTALYWLPLLLLTTGARPNEIAQLQTEDLYPDFYGRPHLNVLCLLDDDDDAADSKTRKKAKDDPRRVKTAAGRRMIPLHPIIIEAGFLEFVKERHNGKTRQLFRELGPDRHGFWSSAITKRLNRIIRGKLGITNKKYSVYSLRHAFIDACKAAAIPEEVRMKFMGHQVEGVHAIYGKPQVLPHESKMIDTVKFEGVDFGLYRRRSGEVQHGK